MKKKVKNLKTGDVCLVQMPSGKVAQVTITNADPIKKVKTVTILFKGETITLSVDDYIEVEGNIGTKIQILSDEQVEQLTQNAIRSMDDEQQFLNIMTSLQFPTDERANNYFDKLHQFEKHMR